MADETPATGGQPAGNGGSVPRTGAAADTPPPAAVVTPEPPPPPRAAPAIPTAQPAPASPQPIAGVFALEDEDKGDNFNLKPKDDRHGPIPEDQRNVTRDVYEVRNNLKLLSERGVFKGDETAYTEFIKRILQAAKVGCVSPNVDPGLATGAIEQIRKDVVRRKGRPLAFRYLCFLGLWCLAGVAVALVFIGITGYFHASLRNYGWVLFGAMAGVWLSVAIGRWEVSFDALQDYLDLVYEPFNRVVFVGLLAAVIALLVTLKALPLSFGSVNLNNFLLDYRLALILGLCVGFGERMLSVQLLDRTRKVLGAS